MKYVLFDLDGTLTDPGLGITNSVMHALDRFGIEKPPREELYCFIGPPLTDSFNKKFGIPVEKAPEAIGYFREYFAEKGILENEIYPGIPELLEALHKKGDMVVLATAKPLRFAKRILDYFDIAKWFDYVGGNDMAETYMKKSDLLRDIFAALGLGEDDLADCLMVGDRNHDVDGAHEAGIKAVGVLYGYGGRDELEAAGADFIVDDVDGLAKLLLAAD